MAWLLCNHRNVTAARVPHSRGYASNKLAPECVPVRDAVRKQNGGALTIGAFASVQNAHARSGKRDAMARFHGDTLARAARAVSAIAFDNADTYESP